MSAIENLLRANDGMIQVAQNAQKKQKTSQSGGGAPYFETIAMQLLEHQRDLRKNFDDSQLNNIEVEVVIFLLI